MFGTTTNSITDINNNNGYIKLGTYNNKDVLWRCFAYSTDDEEWTGCCSEDIPSDATYCYFMLDTPILEFMGGDAFLASDKYSGTNVVRNGYRHNGTQVIDGQAVATTVVANDYYYSDIRQKIRNYNSDLMSLLKIDTTSQIYQAIRARTLSDLYINSLVQFTNNSESFGDLSDPTDADMTQKDTFWLMSAYEVQILMPTASDRIWYDSSDKIYSFELRTALANLNKVGNGIFIGSSMILSVDYDGEGNCFDISNCDSHCGPRVAFKLQLSNN